MRTLAPSLTGTAVAYCRVSYVGDREDSMVSPAVQMESSERFCETRQLAFNAELSESYKDLDVSGYTRSWRKRPGLRRLIEDCRAGLVQHIIVYKLDRWGRNLFEALELLRELERLGVTFWSATEPYDSTTPEGRLALHNQLAMAEYFSAQLSRRVYDAKLYRAQRKQAWNGGSPPCWCRIANDKKTLEPIPEVVLALRRLVELRVEGHGYVAIARRLNEEGYRNKAGRPWRDGAVHKYLREDWIDSMTGTAWFNRKSTDPRKEPVRIPDAYPRVLTDEEASVLRVVQARYAEKPLGRGPLEESGAVGDWGSRRRSMEKSGRLSPNASHLLSGLCKCGACGSRLLSILRSSKESRASRFAYTCTMARANAGDHSAGGYIIAGDALEDAVIRVLRDYLRFPPEPEPKAMPRASAAESNLRLVEQQIDRLTDLYSSGLIEKDDFERRYNPLLSDRRRLLKAQNAESESSLIQHAQDAANTTDRKELRSLLALLVESVEAPVYIPGHTVREGLTTLRRYARVTMKYPDRRGYRTFLAPIHKSDFKGERRVYPEP